MRRGTGWGSGGPLPWAVKAFTLSAVRAPGGLRREESPALTQAEGGSLAGRAVMGPLLPFWGETLGACTHGREAVGKYQIFRFGVKCEGGVRRVWL